MLEELTAALPGLRLRRDQTLRVHADHRLPRPARRARRVGPLTTPRDGGLVGAPGRATALRSAVDRAARGHRRRGGRARRGGHREVAAAGGRRRPGARGGHGGADRPVGGGRRRVPAVGGGVGRSTCATGRLPTRSCGRSCPPSARLLPAWTPGEPDASRRSGPDRRARRGRAAAAPAAGRRRAAACWRWRTCTGRTPTPSPSSSTSRTAAGPTGLLMVVSARDDGPRGAALGRLAGAVVLRAERLSATETAALAAAHAADLPADRLEQGGRRRRRAAAAGRGAGAAGPSGGAATFAALVEQRLADVDDDAAAVLRAAAVLGTPPWTLLPQVADRPEPVVSAGLRAAADAGLLVVRDGELRWRHALTCEAVAATTLPPERAAVARGGRRAARPRRPGRRRGGRRCWPSRARTGGRRRSCSRSARRDLARGALRSAEALFDRVPVAHAVEAAADRVLLLTGIGRAADALEAGSAHCPRRPATRTPSCACGWLGRRARRAVEARAGLRGPGRPSRGSAHVAVGGRRHVRRR